MSLLLTDHADSSPTPHPGLAVKRGRAGEAVPVRAYQITVWVSVSTEETLPRDAGAFPAVLDTGHSHNFSIREEQLRIWAGVAASQLPKRGAILVNQQEVPLLEATLWIYRNRPGTHERLSKPFRLQLPEGISVYPRASLAAPRLPLLGIRGLLRNNLKLTIENMAVWLRQGKAG